MRRIKVWDPAIRIFHWTLVSAFALNAVIDDPESKFHRRVGYVVAALVLFRLVWGLIGSRHARFADFPPDPRAALGQLEEMATGRRHAHVGHSPLGALMIYNLLATLAVICATGYMLTTTAYWGVGWVEDLHGFAVTWAEISVVLHVVAVIAESRRLGVNLFRAMVSGYKEMPARPDAGHADAIVAPRRAG